MHQVMPVRIWIVWNWFDACSLSGLSHAPHQFLVLRSCGSAWHVVQYCQHTAPTCAVIVSSYIKCCIHAPVNSRPDPDVPIEETVRAMNWVIDHGLAFYWGTSEWSAVQIQEVRWGSLYCDYAL